MFLVQQKRGGPLPKTAKEVRERSREGCAYSDLGNAHHRLGGFKRAIYYHEKHLKIAKETEDKAGEGVAYCNIGNAHYRLGDFKMALQYHELDLQIATQLGNKEAEARAHCNLGMAYDALGDFKKAIFYHESDLKYAKEVGDRRAEGHACGNLGNAYHSIGEFRKAIQYHERDLNIANEMGNRTGEGEAYMNLGNAYQRLGDFKKAIEYHEIRLQLSKEAGDVVGEGKACCNLANAYHRLGNFKNAIDFYEQDLAIAKRVGDKAGESRGNANLGSAYYSLGDLKKAIDYHERSLKLDQELGNRAGEGRVYGNLGNDYRSLGNFKKAIECHERCLKIAKEVGDVTEEGGAFVNLAIAYSSLGDFKKSIEYHERNLKIAKKVGDRVGEGNSYGNLGNAYSRLGDFETAIGYHEDSLKIAKEVGAWMSEGHAYGNLGDIYTSLGNLKKAIDYHQLCLKVAKEVGDIASEGRTYFRFATIHHKLDDFKKAIEYSGLHLKIAKEMEDKDGEARGCYTLGCSFESLGSLPEAADCYRSSLKALNRVRDWLQFEDQWKISLVDMYQSVYTSLWRVLLRQEKVVEALLAADKGRAQALNDLMESKYGFPKAFDVSCRQDEAAYDIISCTLSSTIFIALNEDLQLILFWVCQPDKETQLRMARSTDYSSNGDVTACLQSLMKNTRKVIGARDGVACEDRSLDNLRDESLTNFGESGNQDGSHSELQGNPLRTLYDLTISPVIDSVHGDELVIVPEGPLCLAPYAAFMDSNSKYLCESYRIRVIPSLTSLKLIADCPADYHCKTGALLVGDPWVQDIPKTKKRKRLEQLPGARREVEMIKDIVKTAPLIGTEATKENVLSRLSSVALVHIAAHGSMETGEIALAPNLTRGSKEPKEEDFLLTMADVLKLKMRARLVVLSCCHSGRGEIKAEGVVGIARAFLGAGARSVLVSLWAINDEATLEFMKNFYQHLVEGRSTSESLNQAMKCMRESDKFSEVKYWAPFVLIGDDVTLEFPGSE